MKLEGLSLFFPCYNEEANVDRVITEALSAARHVSTDYEIIIVNDGSRDRTADIVLHRTKDEKRIRLINHEKNKGYGETLKSGFRAARMPWVFYSDGDGQFDMNELPKLVEKSNLSDIVSGYRIKRADSWHRILNARIFGLALRIFMGLDIPDIDCAFKLYRREIFDKIQLNTSGAMIDAEVLAKARQKGYRISTVGVTHKPRTAGVQTGAKFHVVFKAMKEFWKLWWDLH